jgi:hypothetical protein
MNHFEGFLPKAIKNVKKAIDYNHYNFQTNTFYRSPNLKNKQKKDNTSLQLIQKEMP